MYERNISEMRTPLLILHDKIREGRVYEITTNTSRIKQGTLQLDRDV